jgi:hypothetical protein
MTAQYQDLSNTPPADSYEAQKRADQYQELKNLGYSDIEIFEDLGNVNFMIKKYETALFWYNKLKVATRGRALSDSYSLRYKYALEQTGGAKTSDDLDGKDWMAMIKADYEIQDKGNEKTLAGATSRAELHRQIDQFFAARENTDTGTASLDMGIPDSKNSHKDPITVTSDGNTAYFSKASYVKPLYGLFSKKQVVHKIYKANKVNGRWDNLKEIALCPKNYSAMHPTISEDGKRLFFASDMPGTFGEFDIYVAAIHSDGSVGIAKNLGEKVNTRRNDLYPSLVGGKTLFFASEGHKGYGGLDVFVVQVDRKKVGRSVNLGSPINSKKDDFSIFLSAEKGMGYVMSNRGKENGPAQRVAFSYPKAAYNKSEEQLEDNLFRVLNANSKIDYSITVFGDD